MGFGLLKILISACLISFVSWLAGRKTMFAGFLTALPITTLFALAFSHFQWQDSKQSVEYAKSIFIAVPVSLLFFVPFLLATKLNLTFWQSYFGGIVLLGFGYFIHAYITKLL